MERNCRKSANGVAGSWWAPLGEVLFRVPGSLANVCRLNWKKGGGIEEPSWGVCFKSCQLLVYPVKNFSQ